jgi:hypothetical protein
LNLQQSLNDVKTFACMTSPQKTQCESCIQVSFFFCCVAPVCFLSDQRAILRTSLNESIIFFFQGFGLVDDERCWPPVHTAAEHGCRLSTKVPVQWLRAMCNCADGEHYWRMKVNYENSD